MIYTTYMIGSKLLTFLWHETENRVGQVYVILMPDFSSSIFFIFLINLILFHCIIIDFSVYNLVKHHMHDMIVPTQPANPTQARLCSAELGLTFPGQLLNYTLQDKLILYFPFFAKKVELIAHYHGA